MNDVAAELLVPKPENVKPPVADVFDVPVPPKTESPLLFELLVPPNTDGELPLKLPKIDGFVSCCGVVVVGVDGVPTDDFSSFDLEVCFCSSTGGFDFSPLVNATLIFSLELNGTFGAELAGVAEESKEMIFKINSR